jgi:hypothetical protein
LGLELRKAIGELRKAFFIGCVLILALFANTALHTIDETFHLNKTTKNLKGKL